MYLSQTVHQLVNITNTLFPRIEINKQFLIINQIMRANTNRNCTKRKVRSNTLALDKYKGFI